MKKTIATCFAILFLVGCVNDTKIAEQVKQNAEQFAQELEAAQDPVKVMDAYITYFQRSPDTFPGNITIPEACEYRDYKDHQDRYDPQKCAIAEALAEPGTLYACNDKENQSDECILYRRNRHATEVGYFDYKRFLGDGTRIKDDKAFVMFAQVYKDIEECEKEPDTTSAEKQECRERQEKYLRLATKQKIHCKKFVENQYKKELWWRRSGYQLEVGGWHYPHSTSINSQREVISKFADRYMCDITGWESDMFK